MASARATAGASGWTLHHGLPVPKLRMKNNVSRTNHGQVAVLARQGLLKPFTPPKEVEDAWRKLHSTCRVAGAWVQATPSIRVLMFSFYGVTRASICATSASLTSDYLGMLFEVASSFGAVPVIIGGDFQSDPSAYKAVQDAIATGTCMTLSLNTTKKETPVSDLPLRTRPLGLLVLMGSWLTQ